MSKTHSIEFANDLRVTFLITDIDNVNGVCIEGHSVKSGWKLRSPWMSARAARVMALVVLRTIAPEMLAKEYKSK